MILMTAEGAKGTAPRELSRAVEEKLSSGKVSPDAVEVIRCGQAAANKAIYRAPRGANVQIQLALEDGPLGGWNLHLIVDVEPGRG